MRYSLALAALTGLILGAGAAPPPVAAQTVRAGAVRVQPAPEPGAGWLGIRSTVTVSFDMAAGQSTAPHLRVDDVYQGGPAWRAGLRAGDVVVGMNGRPLHMERFQSLAARLLPGDPVSLTVLRAGRELEFSVEASRRPGVEVLAPRQIQETLDATRQVFLTRLDSVHVALSADVSAPRVELRRIEADSIRTVERMAEGGRRHLTIQTGDGVFEWIIASSDDQALAPRSFTAWTFRQGDGVVEVWPSMEGDSLRVVARLAQPPVHAPAPTTAPRPESPPFPIVVVGPVDDGTTTPVRPLAPYLAGMNRVAGAEFTPLVGDLATYFQATDGLLVTDVADGTPAWAAGLVPGDVIVEARGRAVATIHQLRAALSLRDGAATLGIVRRGRRVELRLPG